MKLWRWIVAWVLLKLLGGGRPDEGESEEEAGRDYVDGPPGPPVVAPGWSERRAENLVLVLLGLATLCALGFILVYGVFSAQSLPNELLGLCLGLALLCVGGAFAVVGKRLVVTEELEGEYPGEHPEDQEELVRIVHDSGSRITRKRLLLTAGLGTGGVLGAAALTPALSLGPLWDTGPLDETPWKAGIRLVDQTGKPMLAADIYEQSYYTAFPEGADMEDIGSPVAVIRLNPAKLRLPAGRSGWAPDGILAYSKICTHAGCAVALYRKPTFAPVEPGDALVCPCHYSTFDPFTGGTVTYGPAGRPLPQLPLQIDQAGYLRAAGNFSGRVGPSWWNVRSRPT